MQARVALCRGLQQAFEPKGVSPAAPVPAGLLMLTDRLPSLVAVPKKDLPVGRSLILKNSTARMPQLLYL